MVVVKLCWNQVESLSTMSEGSNAGNIIVDVEERCVVKDKLELIETMRVAELKDELVKRKLKITGKKKELQDRLKAFIALEIEHDEDEDEERDVYKTRVKVDSRNTHVLTFRDVEEFTSTYSGDNNVNVQSWLLEFEEMCDLCKWTDVATRNIREEAFTQFGKIVRRLRKVL